VLDLVFKDISKAAESSRGARGVLLNRMFNVLNGYVQRIARTIFKSFRTELFGTLKLIRY
jgi:hypothetical protein